MNSNTMLTNQYTSFLLLHIDSRSLRVQLTNSLCYILVVFGLIGNIFGLVIFSSSRHTWQISSVYVYLATSSSIINLFCVIRYALMLHSVTRLLVSELVGHVWLACKIYELSFAFRVISSWITLFWMFERLTCVSKRLRSVFYRWNSSQWKFLIPSIIILMILGCVLGPSVYMFQPQMFENNFINSTTNPISNFCGLSPKASIQWQKYFYEVHFGPNHSTIRCLFSELFPAGTVIIFNSYIMYYLIQTNVNNKISKERRRTTSWMNLILILHSFLFLSSVLSHIAGHFMSVEPHETWWVLLTVLVNCSVNFYLYCLSGKVFRHRILRYIQRLTTRIICKLQICKQQWKQYQHTCNDDHFISPSDQIDEVGPLESYRIKNRQGTSCINSSSRISDEQASV